MLLFQHICETLGREKKYLPLCLSQSQFWLLTSWAVVLPSGVWPAHSVQMVSVGIKCCGKSLFDCSRSGGRLAVIFFRKMYLTIWDSTGSSGGYCAPSSTSSSTSSAAFWLDSVFSSGIRLIFLNRSGAIWNRCHLAMHLWMHVCLAFAHGQHHSTLLLSYDTITRPNLL